MLRLKRFVGASYEILTGGNAVNGYGREREGRRTTENGESGQGGGRGSGGGEERGRSGLFGPLRAEPPGASLRRDRDRQGGAGQRRYGHGGCGLQDGGDDPCPGTSGCQRKHHRQRGRRDRSPRGKEGRGRQSDSL